MSRVFVLTCWYQQFDADAPRPVPAESTAGWTTGEVALSLAHTAVVVMHAWHRFVEQDPLAVWWRFTGAPRTASCGTSSRRRQGVRRSGLPLFHVVGGGRDDDFSTFRAIRCAGPRGGLAPGSPVAADPVDDDFGATLMLDLSGAARRGRHRGRVREAGLRSDLLVRSTTKASPEDALDRRALPACGINHLIMPVSRSAALVDVARRMVDMARHGVICSVLEDAVTAVENSKTRARSATGALRASSNSVSRLRRAICSRASPEPAGPRCHPRRARSVPVLVGLGSAAIGPEEEALVLDVAAVNSSAITATIPLSRPRWPPWNARPRSASASPTRSALPAAPQLLRSPSPWPRWALAMKAIIPAWSWISCFTSVVRTGRDPCWWEIDASLCLDPEEVARERSHHARGPCWWCITKVPQLI
jgi:hypothetical protein